ncbi:S26 family signal peptidase [Halorhabdus amylolytica]|uniref:S26 family signal peptidase n=1 Tax=Halorhabdus amylolytica TaxID=2559573 RepID=UPI0010AAFA3C|nr:S26 family signal peptidase [Halorhabdus amylolytica]
MGGRNDRRTDRGPPPNRSESTDDSSRSGLVLYVFDIASSILIVAAIGGFLFAASGVWPPLVAIESGSMEPHIQEGDLVFVMEEHRFPGGGAQGDSGVVTAREGRETGYRMFEGYGDVIVYQPYGSTEQTPIIHRAMFWVEEGENWYDEADPEYVSNADSCEELANCPAPHSGFITKGDSTSVSQDYDQAMRITSPVRPEWVIGTAEVRVPILGEIRLLTGQTGARSQARTNSTAAAVGP